MFHLNLSLCSAVGREFDHSIANYVLLELDWTELVPYSLSAPLITHVLTKNFVFNGSYLSLDFD